MQIYQYGDIIEATVSGITDYGIFVNTKNNYSGLIHISEVSSNFVKNINDYVSLGENILCEVIDINEQDNHLKLSIKNINYKLIPRYGKIKDTKYGFKPLQMKLPIWIHEKIKELDNKKTNN